MNKILIGLSLLVYSTIFAQSETINTPGTANSANIQLGGVGAKRVLFAPVTDKSLPLLAGGIEGRIAVNKFTHKLMWNNGSTWLTTIDSLTLKSNYYLKTETDLLYKPISYQATYTDLPDKPVIPTNTNQLTNGSGFITASSSNTFTNKTGNISQWVNNVGYITDFIELDPTVPAYSKSLTAFADIKTATDFLYKPISYAPSSLDITTALGYTPYNSSNPNNYITTSSLHWNNITEKPSFSTVAISGAYSDLSGLPTIPTVLPRTFTVPTFASSTTATQLSATRDSYVQYSYDATVTISLLAGQSITAILEYADNSGMSANLITLDSQSTTNSGVLGLTQTNTLKLSGYVPAGKYRRVRLVQTVGTPTLPTTIKSGQEVQL